MAAVVAARRPAGGRQLAIVRIFRIDARTLLLLLLPRRDIWTAASSAGGRLVPSPLAPHATTATATALWHRRCVDGGLDETARRRHVHARAWPITAASPAAAPAGPSISRRRAVRLRDAGKQPLGRLHLPHHRVAGQVLPAATKMHCAETTERSGTVAELGDRVAAVR
jgi:hypothetical protein